MGVPTSYEKPASRLLARRSFLFLEESEIRATLAATGTAPSFPFKDRVFIARHADFILYRKDLRAPYVVCFFSSHASSVLKNCPEISFKFQPVQCSKNVDAQEFGIWMKVQNCPEIAEIARTAESDAIARIYYDDSKSLACSISTLSRVFEKSPPEGEKAEKKS